MEELALKVEHVSKEYRLGTIGGGTLKAEIQSKIAKLRHKEDPNLKIGQKAYGKNERFLALDDVSFEVKKGEKIGIIGHNGAGKSTVLKLICRVTAPSKGNIYLNGRITSMLEVGTGFHPELTGRENIYLNGSILGMSKAEIDERIDEIIDFSEVRQFIDTPVKRYSSGMHVKLGFAVASHLNSEIMIMDEVLAVGDMAFQNKCINQMKKAAEVEGRTILYVSHNMDTIRRLCDRCIVLGHGKVLFDGDTGTGISEYLNNDSSFENSIDNDLTNVTRFKEYIKETYFIRFRLEDKYSNIYETGSQMRFRLDWFSKTDIEKIGIKMILLTADNQGVGFSSAFVENHKGENSAVMNYDISTLMPGKYKFTLILYTLDPSGGADRFDVVDNSMYFVVEAKRGEAPSDEWYKEWGYCKNNYLTIAGE